MSRAAVVPFAVVASLWAAVGPSPAAAAVVLAVGLVAQLVPARATMSRPAQIFIGIMLLATTTAVLATLFPVPGGTLDRLRTGWGSFAGGMLLVVAARYYLAAPTGGTPLTMALLLVALAACGGIRTPWFVPAMGLFVLAALFALHADDPGRPPLRRLGRRDGAALGAVLGAAGLATWAASELLPPMHTWAIGAIVSRVRSRSGFGRRLELGSLRGMLLSDERVLRVRGEGVDHLRGVIYTDYYRGRWTPSHAPMRPIEPPRSMARGPGVVELEIVEAEPERYFLPLEATAVAVSSGIARVSSDGILAPIAAEPADRIWFRRDGERPYALAPPGRDERTLPRSLRRQLEPLARSWSEGARDPEAALTAIEQRLERDYAYSLEVEHHGRMDPLMSFLLVERRGHCEYFASALALMGRALGIPTRVVGGYRVTEHNELGGYAVVRERNAHTWVEAWIEDRGWVTFDPTPAAEFAVARTTPLAAALFDLAGSGWAAFLSWLDRRTWLEMLTPPIVLLLAMSGLRWWRLRRSRSTAGQRDGDRALPCFEQLSAALSSHGIERRPAETIDQLARRLEQSDAPLAPELAEEAGLLLRRYAALRYGGHGDRGDLESAIERLCQRLKVAPRARGGGSRRTEATV